MGNLLDVPNVKRGNYVLVVDPSQQLTVAGENSKRHRVVNNLPGTPEFCPLITRTEEIDRYLAVDLKTRALQVSSDIPKDVVSRAAAFLLLKDSQASFTIENESPPHDRIMRWGSAIQNAGKKPLSRDELIRLQHIVIGQSPLVKLGFRNEGGFIGEHDRDSGIPIAEHISAKSEDIDSLIAGLIEYDKKAAQDLDPIAAAASIAFGFVNIHPFSDGNGRIHRYLIHHILAERGYNPPGMIFPVSSAMLRRIDEYASVLRSYSQSILPFITWEPTDDHNVRVLNDTADYYRYFDATYYAEFLFSCVKETIEHDLPSESQFLMKYDQFRKMVQNYIEIPDRIVFILYSFLSQNNGRLSKRARKREFADVSEADINHFEKLYNQLFGHNDFSPRL
jgi:Fic family protein